MEGSGFPITIFFTLMCEEMRWEDGGSGPIHYPHMLKTERKTIYMNGKACPIIFFFIIHLMRVKYDHLIIKLLCKLELVKHEPISCLIYLILAKSQLITLKNFTFFNSGDISFIKTSWLLYKKIH